MQQQQPIAYGNQWEDSNRNTYSPALSHRSATATPLTTGSHHHPFSNVQQIHSGHQQYQQHYGSTLQMDNGDSRNINATPSTSATTNNPYSISNFEHQHTTPYHQQSVDPNIGYGISQNMIASVPQTQNLHQQQLWTGEAGQSQGYSTAYPLQPQQHAQPNNLNSSYGQVQTQPNLTNDDSSSRPASVVSHTHMV